LSENQSYSISKEKYCVIIPTYNNASKIEAVIEDVLKETQNIIVVNDGATDDTALILEKYKTLTIISYTKNKGKGFAIKKGFKKAIELGFDYAITIDSDGQHIASEIPNFVTAHNKNKDAIIIGARTTINGNVPRKNSFANKFSNFWFLVITGIKLDDTQSGFRLYPLNKMRKIRLLTRRYEFEIEVMVKASWKNIPIESIPISVIYPPTEERITHFRPVADFFRISLLNSWLVFLSLAFYRPFAILKKLNRKNIAEFFDQNLIRTKDSNAKIILSIMFGVYMGIIPLWGYQLISAIALAHVFKLNKLIVGVAANISITPMIPIIIYLSYLTGGIVMGTDISTLPFNAGFSLDLFTLNIEQYLLGSVILASGVSALFGLFFYILLLVLRRNKV
jgi:glycosyltransferase involved in cell wall biosynthesis